VKKYYISYILGSIKISNLIKCNPKINRIIHLDWKNKRRPSRFIKRNSL